MVQKTECFTKERLLYHKRYKVVQKTEHSTKESVLPQEVQSASEDRVFY